MRMIISIVIAFMVASFATPASAFVFGVQTDDFSFAISVPDNQGNQNNHYYEPRPQYQWPRTTESRRHPQYNTPPPLPSGWVFKNDFEQKGGHCGRIDYYVGEWICRPE